MAGVVTKKKRFSSVLTLSKKKTNQHQIFHLDPQRAGFMVNPNGIIVMVVRKCMNLTKYTLIRYEIHTLSVLGCMEFVAPWYKRIGGLYVGLYSFHIGSVVHL